MQDKFFKRIELSLNDPEMLKSVAHALSTDLRLRILQMISKQSMSIIELAEALAVPVSTISVNIGVLDKARLIEVDRVSGVHGRLKRCIRVTDAISIDLFCNQGNERQTGEINMPIGAFSRCEGIMPSCGLASVDDYIGQEDEPMCFYMPQRMNAQIMWFRQGYVEYRFPVMQLRSPNLEKIELLFEACSETIGYNNDYKSDISLTINDVCIGSWESPGDFGGRRGLMNPHWWPSFSSQYGVLKNWRVTREGSYLDSIRISDVTLDDLHLDQRNYMSLRIGVEADARYVGGINLFGKGFGDYPQDIVLRYFIS